MEVRISLILLFVVTVMAVGGLAAQPRFGPSKASLLPTPQSVHWYAAYKNDGPGMCAQEAKNSCPDFLGWPDFKAEMEQKVLPQARDIPRGSSLLVSEDGETVSIVAPDGNTVGVILMQDQDRSSRVPGEGFLYISDPAQRQIWYKFQRFSDKSYIQTPLARVELPALLANLTLTRQPPADEPPPPAPVVARWRP